MKSLYTCAILFCLALFNLHAAVRPWSGVGADDNWNTAANWGGTVPVNADIVVFSGPTRQNNPNNISSLSVNGLGFANHGFTLNGNQLALNGPVTNSAGTNLLALPVNVTVQNAVWNLAPGSELRISGVFTNSTTANPLATLGFGGTVRFTSPSNCLSQRFFTLTSGAVIADGCNLTILDGFRCQPPPGSNAVFQITNNGSFTIASGGNLRLCQSGGGTSRVDVASGILNMAITSGAGAGDIFVGEAAGTTTIFNQNGGLVEFTGNGNNRIAFANASASANGTYNLNGGTLWAAQIVQVTAGSPGGTFNFNGGTLKPTTASATFFQGVQTANVQAGGAIIDTTNLNITIGQVLGGSGPLTKTGTGTLTLSGNMTLVKDGTNTATISTADTYTGNTTIKAGEIILGNNTALGASTSTVTVQNGASLDLAGYAPGLQPIVVGGNGAGGNGALISDTTDQNDALRAVTLTTTTTIRTDTLIGIRMPAETDPGFNGNGFKLIKTGAAALNLNGGQTAIAGTNIWDSNLGDIDVQQGQLSFERRMTMGRATNTITVEAGASLKYFSLNTNVLPLQVKPIHLVTATLQADTAVAGDYVPIGCSVTVDAGTNFISTLAGGGSGGCTFLLEGPISGAGSVYYSGTNQLAGTNTYTGSTVVTAGTLQLIGTGSIANSAAVTVQANTAFDVSQVSPWTLGSLQTLGGNGTVLGNVVANGKIAPGSSIGTLNVSGDLTINGNLAIEVDKSQVQSNDVTTVSGALSNTSSGTLTVSNLGPALVVGDKFTLFSQPVSGGGTLTVTGGSATWTNNLAVDGSISVLSISATSPPYLTNSIIGNVLNFSWGTAYLGYHLEVQTNSLSVGLGTNWDSDCAAIPLLRLPTGQLVPGARIRRCRETRRRQRRRKPSSAGRSGTPAGFAPGRCWLAGWSCESRHPRASDRLV